MNVATLRETLQRQGRRSIVGLYGIGDHGRFGGPRWTHDHNAACYSSSGRLDWYFELERLTGVKHDNRLETCWRDTPLHALERSAADFIVGSVTSFAGCSFVAHDRTLRIDCGPFGASLDDSIIPARGSVTTDPLNVIPAWGVAQELAHPFAGVAFAGVPKLPALLVHSDGGATVSSFSAFVWTEQEITCIEADWETVDAAMNFGFNDLFHEMLGQNDDERLATAGRLMGLAAFATSASDEMIQWLEEHSWFRNHWADPATFYRCAKERFGWRGHLHDVNDGFVQNLAGCAQRHLERTIVRRLRRLRERTAIPTLYAGGGTFLNIHLNAAVEAEHLFDTFVVPPNTSDSGLGLGAACLLTWLRDGEVHPVTPFIQYRGAEAGAPTVVDPRTIDEAVERLIRGQAIAVVSAAAEAGPRSLGHRSIICLPTVEAVVRVSEKIKGREWYRPVAPIGLAEIVAASFGNDLSTPLVRWMLTVRRPTGLDRAWRGAVHVDGSARLQVVCNDDPQQAVMTALLERIWQRARVPCLINTSLNRRGSPICNVHADAANVARQLGVDGIIADGRASWWTPPSTSYPGAID